MYFECFIFFSPFNLLVPFSHGIVEFVSEDVALDSFTNCHDYPLKGNRILVNFTLKPTASKKNAESSKSEGTATTNAAEKQKKKASLSSNESSAKKVGKVIIEEMKDEKPTKKKSKGEGYGLMELIKNTRKRDGKEDESEDEDQDDDDVDYIELDDEQEEESDKDSENAESSDKNDESGKLFFVFSIEMILLIYHIPYNGVWLF